MYEPKSPGFHLALHPTPRPAPFPGSRPLPTPACQPCRAPFPALSLQCPSPFRLCPSPCPLAIPTRLMIIPVSSVWSFPKGETLPVYALNFLMKSRYVVIASWGACICISVVSPRISTSVACIYHSTPQVLLH